MQSINRSNFILLALLYLIANSAWAAVDSNPEKKSSEPPLVVPPPISSEHLNCTAQMAQQPHIKLMAKTKQQDQYGTLNLGCIPVATETQALLNDKASLALDDAVAYLTDRSTVIRVYIDISGPKTKDKALQTRYRKQAFAIKQYLTQKGVYAHLKKIREKHFKSAFPEDQKKKKLSKKTLKKTIKAKPKPPDPSKKYTYHMDKNQRALGNSPITQYVSQETNSFGFIPLESIYFPHNQYKLTMRAKATLNEAADYIMDTLNATKVIIEAHADHTASIKYNYRLTDHRARATRDYLLSRGVPIALLEISSRGEATPIDETWTRSGQARNRRVTLYVITQLSSVEDISQQNAVPTQH
ncbi:hypothetical protein MNBD_GAMMA16-550 [hydrothermal vent metagenome]|uniref:OmpA-like domain-containing protein n=1 Tax=hydrothermal vent metagenome TaxID=652676 RepID=A0A3B0ZT62_9ZZZZ